jgi:Asp-tRNA(Asn)/Glu-tRNA(Gln) amidotransferase A subunit family amidase
MNELDLPVRRLASLISTGELTAEAVVRGFLERITTREQTLKAWAHVDVEGALEEARRPASTALAPLKGVPIGVKDIIDTADMPTGYGSTLYAGFRPAADAACVALAREAGAVVLGKTVTAEFALASPGPTRNPCNEAHTPGGTSSGSAAAVSAGMVPLALGTQTGGSIIRPAAYCGVVGYKPSFGLIDRTGSKRLSDSIDTLGVIARSVEDAAFFAGTLARRDLLGRGRSPALRVGLYGVEKWGELSAGTRAALHRAATAFQYTGAHLIDVCELTEQEALGLAYETIVLWEITSSLAFERTHHLMRLRAQTREILSLPPPDPAEYETALALVAAARSRLAVDFGHCDVLLSPAALDEAPKGLESTGDPMHCLIWTLLHAPCITVPVMTGPRGLPLGVQLVGRIGDDARLIRAAMVVEEALDRRPPYEEPVPLRSDTM